MSPWLRMHGHALADALQRIAAQPLASTLSIAVLATAIALPIMAGIGLRTAGTATASLDTEPHVNVFMSLDASDDEVKRVEQALRSNADAAAVRFISRAQALEELKATTHLAEILAALERNPLPHAFTVRVRTAAPDRVARMRAQWSALPKVDQVTADFEWAERLGRWVRFGERVLWTLAVALGCAVAFIVGHLIRLQVLTRRDEIEVSQLIGATAADVRRPFLYHGLVQGLLAGGLGLAVAAGLWAWLGGELLALTPSYASELKILFPRPNEWAAVLAMTAGLGLVGAWLAVDREIRLFSRR